MNGFGNLNLNFSLILANLVFVSSLNTCSAALSMKNALQYLGQDSLKIAIIILAFKKVALRESSNNTSI